MNITEMPQPAPRPKNRVRRLFERHPIGAAGLGLTFLSSLAFLYTTYTEPANLPVGNPAGMTEFLSKFGMIFGTATMVLDSMFTIHDKANSSD